MSLKLYFAAESGPCRATLLTIRALNLDVELVPIDLLRYDHLTNEFLELNPFHTVPTLEDEGVCIWDSHSINTYLVDKYGSDDSLYPKDLAKRAIVNQRLHFDSGVLEARFRAIVESIIKGGARIVAKDKADSFIQGLTLLETALENNKYVSGNDLTIADFSIATSIYNSKILIPIAANRFPKIIDWMKRIEELPYFNEVNREGLEKFEKLIKSKNVVK